MFAVYMNVSLPNKIFHNLLFFQNIAAARTINTIYLLLKLTQTIYLFFEKIYLNTIFHTPDCNQSAIDCNYNCTIFEIAGNEIAGAE